MRSFKGIIGISWVLITPLYAWDIDSYRDEAMHIMSQMTLREKIGQIVLPSYRLLAAGEWFSNATDEPVVGYQCKQDAQIKTSIQAHNKLIKACGLDEISQFQLGGVYPDAKYSPFFINESPDVKLWQKLTGLSQYSYKKTNAYKKYHLPLLLGTDGIHGDSHTAGAVIFPHNINLGMTHSPQLIKQVGQQAGVSIKASGFNWTFAPTVAIAKDYRWGRTYESFGTENELVSQMSRAYILGLQSVGVLATAKHFIGDGGTDLGQDEGNVITQGSLFDFWQQHGAGYEGAVQADAGSVMASYSAINGERVHLGTSWDLINRFKLGAFNNVSPFTGFVVSDYTAISRSLYYYNQQHPQAPLTYVEAIAHALHTGVDMIMAGRWNPYDPFNAGNLQDYYYHHLLYEATMQDKSLLALIEEGVNAGKITLQDLNRAVVRIIAVKLALAQQLNPNRYRSTHAKAIALKAAEQSLVLLKNRKTLLPIQFKNISNVILLDNQLNMPKLSDANNIGLQNGGWSIAWQGQKGNAYFEKSVVFNWQHSSGASTIFSELKKRFPKANFYSGNLTKSKLKQFNFTNTLVIAVLAEPPYAEFMGDVGNQNPWFLQGMKSKSNLYTPKCVDPADWSSCQQPQALRLVFNSKLVKVIKRVKKFKLPLLTVVFSGRPIVLTENTTLGKAPWKFSDAVIAAFLPGTLGGKAIVNTILGDYRFKASCSSLGCANTLSFPWPKTQQDITTHFYRAAFKKNQPPFDVGYGLDT